MSRTYKDRPKRIRFPQYYDDDRYTVHKIGTTWSSFWDKEVTIYWIQDTPGYRRKHRRTANTNWKWASGSPSWWTRLTMNRPARHRWRLWEHKVVEYIEPELADYPNYGNKPFNYFY